MLGRPNRLLGVESAAALRPGRSTQDTDRNRLLRASSRSLRNGRSRPVACLRARGRTAAPRGSDSCAPIKSEQSPAHLGVGSLLLTQKLRPADSAFVIIGVALCQRDRGIHAQRFVRLVRNGRVDQCSAIAAEPYGCHGVRRSPASAIIRVGSVPAPDGDVLLRLSRELCATRLTFIEFDTPGARAYEIHVQ